MTQAPAPYLVEANGISKSFPGVRALDRVDICLRAGEVLAVVGENGAGKSTLMKILAGVQQPNSGSLRLNGKPFAPASVHDSLQAGVALIHQELNLAGNLDIASNICLGREPRRLGFINRRACESIARKALESIRLNEPVDRRVEALTIGHRQMVEIAKALAINARVLIMDEPTSSLSLGETEQLFAVVRQLKSRGVGVIYISHRLAEVEAIADRVLVLRDGRVSGHLDSDQIERERMMQLMVGRELSGYTRRQQPNKGNVRLELREVRTRRFPASSVNLHVHAGEIVGVAGLVGAGRTELLEGIFGIAPPLSGTIRVDDHDVALRTPRDAIAAGLALVPEDRQQHGLIVEQTLRRNIGMPELERHARVGFVNRSRERDSSRMVVSKFNVRAFSDVQIVQTLSGGNQQKVALGKWLTLQPGVLLLDEPTRGVDVGARGEIYRIIEDMASNGVATLFASSDLEEIIAMSDRVLVMRDGAITGELPRDQLTEEAIMRMATLSEHAA